MPDASYTTADKLALTFPVLSDVGNRVARKYGLVFILPEQLRPIYAGLGIDIPAANGDDSFELPVPATYVIDTKGPVEMAFIDADYTQRLDPETVISVLRKIRQSG